MSSTTSSSTPKRVDLVSFPRPAATERERHRPAHPPRRRADPRARGPAGAARRLGASPPGPRRAGVHRPARPRRTGAALLQPRLDAARGDGARRGARAPRRWCWSSGTVALRPGAVARRGARLARGRGPRHRSASRRARAQTPAIPVARKEKEELPAEELRLKHRVLDLRRPELQREPDPPPPAAAAGAPHAHRARASSRSRRRSSPSRRPKARATTWCRAGCTRASSTRCRSRPRSTSSC